MGDIKNLTDREAIEKLQKLAKDIDICMFCTQLDNLPIETRPMSTNSVDEEGNIWFISSKLSEKNIEIKENIKVQLVYSKPSDAHFLTVTGSAQIVTDKYKIDELWDNIAKAWFPEGKDDPNVSLIKVIPQEVYYWDTKHGKMVSLLKIGAAMVSGKVMDDGVEGSIKV